MNIREIMECIKDEVYSKGDIQTRQARLLGRYEILLESISDNGLDETLELYRYMFRKEG